MCNYSYCVCDINILYFKHITHNDEFTTQRVPGQYSFKSDDLTSEHPGGVEPRRSTVEQRRDTSTSYLHDHQLDLGHPGRGVVLQLGHLFQSRSSFYFL